MGKQPRGFRAAAPHCVGLHCDGAPQSFRPINANRDVIQCTVPRATAQSACARCGPTFLGGRSVQSLTASGWDRSALTRIPWGLLDAATAESV
jgi:hypothetical protein